MLTNMLADKYPFLLPKPDPDIEYSNGAYGLQAQIPDHILESADRDEYLRYLWRDMYHRLTSQLVSMFFGRDDRFSVQFSPIITSREFEWMTTTIRLQMSVMAITEQRMVIPIIEFDNKHGGIKEWRCGYCNVPQHIEERTCCNCGAPRALLVHEM